MDTTWTLPLSNLQRSFETSQAPTLRDLLHGAKLFPYETPLIRFRAGSRRWLRFIRCLEPWKGASFLNETLLEIYL